MLFVINFAINIFISILFLAFTNKKNNKIIILDEPTSSIDVYTKSLIMKAITKLSKKRTLIIITHDKELLKLVERVVVIKSGEIVEDMKNI